MDFDFIFERDTRRYSVVTDGEFIAVGRFVSTEFDASAIELEQFVQWLEDCVDGRKTFTEWTVDVCADEVEIIANQELEADTMHTEPETTTLDWESKCACGKDDLLSLLRAYIRFKK